MRCLDLEGFASGDVVADAANPENQPLAEFGVRLNVVNLGGGPDLAVIFDTEATGTLDPDLEDPWAGGNIDPYAVLGKALIIQEHAPEYGPIDPDDEAGGGALYLDFIDPATGEPVTANNLGFDLIDIEAGEATAGYLGFYLAGEELATISFADTPGAPGYGAPSFGDNHANRFLLDAEALSQMGVNAFDKVKFRVAGSGAVDNVKWSLAGPPVIPEPGTLALLALGGLAVAARRRRRA